MKIQEILPFKVVQGLNDIRIKNISDIIFTVDKPVCVKTNTKWQYLSEFGLEELPQKGIKTTSEEIDTIMYKACDYSVYTHEDEIANGFVALDGGYRVGVCGRCVKQNNRYSVCDVTSLIIRIPHQVVGCSDRLLPIIINDGLVGNTLIIGEPGSGKTTYLRDIIRNLSNAGYRVSCIDSRGELSGVHNRKEGFDLGSNTSVMLDCDKEYGIQTAIRTQSPDVIATDEIGFEDSCLHEACNMGVSVVFTAHSNGLDSIRERKNIQSLFSSNRINHVFYVDRTHSVKEIFSL